MGRMITDRWRLRRVDGLTFARVLGTGRGGGTGPSFDLRRQAYFLVWADPAAARHFREHHQLARRWRRLDVEHDLGLRLVSGHGSWSGRDVLAGMQPVEAGGETVVLTRARIRMRSWRAFRRASRRTAAAVASAPGVRWTIGVGELPVGLLGTVSCWRNAADIDAFAADRPHAAAAAHAPVWFTESLFARFHPFDLSDGSPTCLPGTGN